MTGTLSDLALASLAAGGKPGSIADLAFAAAQTGGGGGGGSTPGAAIVRKFPFAFNTPGLAAGATLYTPTAGDILLNGWIEVDTAWNGTTPKADIGTFVGTVFGWLTFNSTVDMTKADSERRGTGVLVGSDFSNASIVAATGGNERDAPSKLLGTEPIKVVVSTTGASNGADPGATQGAAVLYLVTATPV